MSSLPRLLGFALVLLLAFIGAVAGAQLWLRSQHERLEAASLASQRDQAEAAVALLFAADGTRDEARVAGLLAAVLGVESVELLAADASATAAGAGRAFTVPLPSGRLLLITPSPTAATRLLALHQRVVVALVVFALLLLLALVLVLLLRPAAPVESGSRPPWVFAKAEMGSLQHLARTSVTQGAELARERDERMRAQEEAYVNQVRLNQALEEKIRLGRDLHDGIIQSLYATGLTLENVRDLVERNPPEAVKRLQGSIDLLNAAIRDVRAYITGLKSDPARDAGLSTIVERIAAELKADREVAFAVEIDDFAAARLPGPVFADVVQVVREAVSNALRHGAARHVTVRLHEGDGALALLVQDDGAGFATDGGSRGHGLANMRGRAESAGGSLQVESAPGRGTRIVLTLPLTAPSS